MRLLLLMLAAAPVLFAETRQIRILQTTDLHGWIYPYDYFTARPANRGLAKAATLIRQSRAARPDALLIDSGDTLQGSPLESVYQVETRAAKSRGPEPMMLAMNALRYDAMTVGNHEFNYGLANLAAARSLATFPFLSANTLGRPGGSGQPFAPYLLKTVNGIRVAIIGLTTGGIPEWEKPENYAGLRWEDQVTAARRAFAEVKRKKADLVILSVHGGLDRDPKTGQRNRGEIPNDNRVNDLAEALPGLDVLFYGHTHQVNEGTRIGNVLLVQARNWAQSVAQVDVALERSGGGWKVTEKQCKLLPVTGETPADPEILKLAAPYHDAAERYLTTELAQSPVELTGERARIEDTPIVDAIHEVQLHYAKADVSFTSLFQPGIRIRKGPVTVREMAALYIYDNELYALEGNGKMVREALENAARYFEQCKDAECRQGPLVNPAVAGYNYDIAQGVSYEVDLTQPAGNRIRKLAYKGAPLGDDQPLRLAVNNYRAGGSAGYTMFQGAKVLWRSGREIRELLIEYFREHKELPSRADGNWRITPESALAVLEQELRGPMRR
jgi:2',3'-cyclic-nucleotide 2'-phosphodiesterase/3'-nucleotidase